MATRNKQRQVATRQGLSPAEALSKLAMIDRAIDAVCNTAPRTIEARGGRDWLLSISQFTCIGPMPRLSLVDWSLMSHEHKEAQREQIELRARPLWAPPSQQEARPLVVGSSFRIVR